MYLFFHGFLSGYCVQVRSVKLKWKMYVTVIKNLKYKNIMKKKTKLKSKSIELALHYK